MKSYCLRMLIAVLVFTAIACQAQALTTCQDDCNSQHYSAVNSLWQTPRPATTAPTTHQQQVMAAMNTLNQCMAACSTSAAEPTPTEPTVTTPTEPRRKR